jgi:endo-chitodextinase
MSLDQVHDFANYIVYINGIVGDGINIDYEHLSATGMDRKERIKTMAHLLHYTRRALIGARLEWKTITYTCKYNAVYNDTNRPDGFKKFESDGELVEIARVLKEDFNEKLETNVQQLNIMFYDQPPADINAPATGPTTDNYRQIMNAATDLFPVRGIHMGFEPGPQANGGVWEGAEVDKDVTDILKV